MKVSNEFIQAKKDKGICSMLVIKRYSLTNTITKKKPMPQLAETKKDTRQTYFSEFNSLECFYSVYLKKYCLQFNGVYFFYITLKAYKLNRDKYIKKYNLTLNN